ncbi:MAG: S8 family serine peptidase [Micrococcus sp.]|nr:S8 family serine peptidase [Micrococcus sp.]
MAAASAPPSSTVTPLSARWAATLRPMLAILAAVALVAAPAQALPTAPTPAPAPAPTTPAVAPSPVPGLAPVEPTEPGGLGARPASGRYIVVLAEEPSVTYDGGRPGLGPTAAVDGEFDAESTAVARYETALRREQESVAASVGVEPDQQFTRALNGFAAQLSTTQVGLLEDDPRVAGVFADEPRPLNAGPAETMGMTGATGTWATTYGGQAAAGKGAVIAVIDTGIDPRQPFFAAAAPAPVGTTPRMGEPYRRADGQVAVLKADGTTASARCAAGPDFPASSCTAKLIGAGAFSQGFVSAVPVDVIDPAERMSPADVDGHGTHVASTAAGRVGVPLVVDGAPAGTGSGMAPGAALVSYKACWLDIYGIGCWPSDTISAVEQAITDNVDVINYSVGGRTDQIGDPVSVAFRSAARAGIFVAAAAGNSGPGYSTVEHGAPWITSVAAAEVTGASGASVTGRIADFSARGPSGAASGEILAPQVAAPGVGVVAGLSSLTIPGGGTRFGAMEGTSMASPHVAGMAALLAARNPQWSPMAIKSAMMTTATAVQESDGSEDPDNYATGAGMIAPRAMADPGLVFTTTDTQWGALLRGELAPRQVNQPAVALSSLSGPVTVTRTATAVRAGTWNVAGSVPGFRVTANPARVSLAAGQSVAVQLTFTPVDAAHGVATHGAVTFSGTGVPTASLPVSIRVPAATITESVSGSTASGSGTVQLTGRVPGSAQATVVGLSPAQERTVTKVPVDYTDPNFGEEGPGTARFEITVGAGVDRLEVHLTSAARGTAYWMLDIEGPGGVAVYDNTELSATGERNVVLETPVPGTYRVRAMLLNVTTAASDTAIIETVQHRAGTSNVSVTPATVTLAPGAARTATLAWSGLTPGSWRGRVEWRPWAGGPVIATTQVHVRVPGTSTCTARDFTDNPRGSVYYAPVRWMQCAGITTGYADGTYRKSAAISRGESVTFLYRLLQPAHTVPARSPFRDVAVGSTFFPSITWAASTGVTRGYADGTFRPGRNVTRAEFSAFVQRILAPTGYTPPRVSPFADVSTSHPHYAAISWLTSQGLLTGYRDGTFRPGANITRGETAVIMQRTDTWRRGTG